MSPSVQTARTAEPVVVAPQEQPTDVWSGGSLSSAAVDIQAARQAAGAAGMFQERGIGLREITQALDDPRRLSAALPEILARLGTTLSVDHAARAEGDGVSARGEFLSNPRLAAGLQLFAAPPLRSDPFTSALKMRDTLALADRAAQAGQPVSELYLTLRAYAESGDAREQQSLLERARGLSSQLERNPYARESEALSDTAQRQAEVHFQALLDHGVVQAGPQPGAYQFQPENLHRLPPGELTTYNPVLNDLLAQYGYAGLLNPQRRAGFEIRNADGTGHFFMPPPANGSGIMVMTIAEREQLVARRSQAIETLLQSGIRVEDTPQGVRLSPAAGGTLEMLNLQSLGQDAREALNVLFPGLGNLERRTALRVGEAVFQAPFEGRCMVRSLADWQAQIQGRLSAISADLKTHNAIVEENSGLLSPTAYWNAMEGVAWQQPGDERPIDVKLAGHQQSAAGHIRGLEQLGLTPSELRELREAQGKMARKHGEMAQAQQWTVVAVPALCVSSALIFPQTSAAAFGFGLVYGAGRYAAQRIDGAPNAPTLFESVYASGLGSVELAPLFAVPGVRTVAGGGMLLYAGYQAGMEARDGQWATAVWDIGSAAGGYALGRALRGAAERPQVPTWERPGQFWTPRPNVSGLRSFELYRPPRAGQGAGAPETAAALATPAESAPRRAVPMYGEGAAVYEGPVTPRVRRQGMNPVMDHAPSPPAEPAGGRLSPPRGGRPGLGPVPVMAGAPQTRPPLQAAAQAPGQPQQGARGAPPGFHEPELVGQRQAGSHSGRGGTAHDEVPSPTAKDPHDAADGGKPSSSRTPQRPPEPEPPRGEGGRTTQVNRSPHVDESGFDKALRVLEADRRDDSYFALAELRESLLGMQKRYQNFIEVNTGKPRTRAQQALNELNAQLETLDRGLKAIADRGGSNPAVVDAAVQKILARPDTAARAAEAQKFGRWAADGRTTVFGLKEAVEHNNDKLLQLTKPRTKAPTTADGIVQSRWDAMADVEAKEQIVQCRNFTAAQAQSEFHPPVRIPGRAQVKSSATALACTAEGNLVMPGDRGAPYRQIGFIWEEGGYRIEARWHTKTPGCPDGTQPNWRVTRTHQLSGRSEELVGVEPDGTQKWVSSQDFSRDPALKHAGHFTADPRDGTYWDN